MQVAHRSHVIDMLDGGALKQVIEQEDPDLVVPEIEAIATPTLVEMERNGLRVIPTAGRCAYDDGSRGYSASSCRGTGCENVCILFRR